MSDLSLDDLRPKQYPRCPVCGGETAPIEMHKAVAKVTDIFRCKRCSVEYPVSRRGEA